MTTLTLGVCILYFFLSGSGIPTTAFGDRLSAAFSDSRLASIHGFERARVRFAAAGGLLLEAEGVRFEVGDDLAGFDVDAVTALFHFRDLSLERLSIQSFAFDGAHMRVGRDAEGDLTIAALNRNAPDHSATWSLGSSDILSSTALHLPGSAPCLVLGNLRSLWGLRSPLPRLRNLQLSIDDAVFQSPWPQLRIDADLRRDGDGVAFAFSVHEASGRPTLDFAMHCDDRRLLRSDLILHSENLGHWTSHLGFPANLARLEAPASTRLSRDAEGALSVVLDIGAGALRPTPIHPDLDAFLTPLAFASARLEFAFPIAGKPGFDLIIRRVEDDPIHLVGAVDAAGKTSGGDLLSQAFAQARSEGFAALDAAAAGRLTFGDRDALDWRFEAKDDPTPALRLSLTGADGSGSLLITPHPDGDDLLFTIGLNEVSLADALNPLSAAAHGVGRAARLVKGGTLVRGDIAFRSDAAPLSELNAALQFRNAALKSDDGSLELADVNGAADYADGEWRIQIDGRLLSRFDDDDPASLRIENLTLRADADLSGGGGETKIAAPLAAVMKLEAALSRRIRPLAPGLDRDTLSGDAQIDLRFPYFRWDAASLTPRRAFIDALETARLSADIRNFKAQAPPFLMTVDERTPPWRIEAERIVLNGKPGDAIDIRGDLDIEGVDVVLHGELRRLTNPKETHRHLRFAADIDDIGAFFNADRQPLTAHGSATIGVDIIESKDHDGVVARTRIDATDLDIAIPALGWRKERGFPANAAMRMGFVSERVLKFDALEFAGGGLEGRGSLTLSNFGENATAALAIEEASFDDETKLSAVAEYEKGKLSAVLLDFDHLTMTPALIDYIRSGFAPDFLAEAGKADAPLGGILEEETVIQLQAKRAIAHNGVELKDATLISRRQGDRAHRLSLSAGLPENHAFELDYAAYFGGGKTLRVNSDDFGVLLAAIGYSDAAEGGALSLQGDSYPEQRRNIVVSVDDFTLTRNGLSAIAPLGGVMARAERLLDPRSGEDPPAARDIRALRLTLGFNEDKLNEGRFEIVNGLIETEGRYLQFRGDLSLDGRDIAMTGAYLPAAALDRIAGEDGENGAGDDIVGYAIELKGAVLEPDVKLTLLERLDPDLLRRLFDF